MPLPASGAISLNNIQTEFGGSNPIALNEYYRGGGLVPDVVDNNAVPTSGQISVSNFYSTVNRTFSLADFGASISDVNSFSASVTINVNRNGSLSYNTTSAGTTNGNWTLPNGTTVGDNYDVRVTLNSGNAPTSGTTGTWQAINTARQWVWDQTGSGVKSADITIEVRKTGGTVMATQSNISIYVEAL